MPWPLVGTGKAQPLPFLLLRWVEVRRIFDSCLLESPPTAGDFGATGGEIHGLATRTLDLSVGPDAARSICQ